LWIKKEQSWKARTGKPDYRVAKVNFGTLGESEWEEELSTASMR